MWAVSQNFLNTLVRSHTQLVKIDILQDGAYVGTVQGTYTDPTTHSTLAAVDGSITVDKTTIRRSGTITFLNPGGALIPKDTGDLLAPYVTELRVWVGVRYWYAPLPIPYTSQSSGQLVAGVPQNEVEYAPVGTLVITDVDTANFPQITCQCYDRAWLMSSFPAPYTIPTGTDVVTAITGLLTISVPGSRLVTNFQTSTAYTLPATTFDQSASIGDAATQVAASVGLQFFADPMGTFVFDDQPTTADPPVLTLQPAPNTALLRPTKHIGEQVGQMYNAVVFTGEGGSTTPVQGYAEDDDPTSLTYVGRVGVRPFFDSSPLVTTTDQANAAALMTLRAMLGVSQQLVVPILPNPALESGDVVTVIDSQQSINENAIVDTFTVNLRASAGTQQLNCRVRVTN